LHNKTIPDTTMEAPGSNMPLFGRTQ